MLATFTVTNSADRNPDGTTVAGSFRDAIEKSNVSPGPDMIAFQIAGSGVHTISPTTLIGPAAFAPLPAITDAVTIDGTTQTGYAGTPLIELSGANITGINASGLRLETGSVTVRALAINRFNGAGITIDSGFDSIQLCYLGTNTTGTAASPNGGPGIAITGGSNNIIGGSSPTGGGAFGNVLSGNAGAGLVINGSGATNNIVQGNYIGTNAAGAQGAGNTGDGLVLSGGAAFNQIGGSAPGAGNVISGNGGNGIAISGASGGNSVFGNFIGVAGVQGQSGGNNPVPNGKAGIAITGGSNNTKIGGSSTSSQMNFISANTGAGVDITDSTGTQILGNIIGTDSTGTRTNLGNLGAGINVNNGDNTVIGGTLGGAANVIENNGKTAQAGGVFIQAGRLIPILSNSFAGNAGLAITLQSPGAQPVQNDPGDADSGPNDLQNYPVLTQAATASGRTLIQGSLDSKANNTYTVQVFISPTRDPSNHGEALSLLGQFQVTTDVDGHADINQTLPTPSVIGQFVSATATDAQGNTSELALDTSVVAANQAALAVTIAASPDPSTLGSDLTYTITVSNFGPDPATNITFVQQLPAGVTYKGASGATITSSGNTLRADLGAIDVNGTLTFTVTVTPTAIGQVTTTATVASDEIDPDTSDNTATNTVNVNIPADLGVVLLSVPPSATVGQNVSIRASVQDFGPGATTGTILRLTLPPGVSFVSASAGQGITTFANGVVTANIGSLASGGIIAVTVVVTAPINVPDSGDLPFTATVSANEIEPAGPDAHPNTVTIAVPVLPSSDLGLDFSASPQPVLAGADLTFTYRVTNNGLSPATGVKLSDTIPAGLTFLAAPSPTVNGVSVGSASFVTSSGKLTVLIGDLAPGDTAVGTFVVRPAAPGIIPNTATVTLDQPDPDMTNNAATVVTTISPADLSVRIGAAPDPVEAGKNLTYTVFVTNNGPAAATNVILTDTLPDGVTYVGGAAGQGTVLEQDGVVTALLNTITPGASVAVTIVVTPAASGRLVDTAAVSSDQVDVNGGDNSAASVTFASPANLAVLLSASPDTALAGNPITFTAFVTNAGTSAATGVLFADTLPAGLTLVSATSSQGDTATGPSNVSAQIGTLLPGASATITIVAVASTDGTYTNSATVSADEVDPDLTDNTSATSITVTNAPGVLQFAAPTFVAGENSGLAVVTITRTGGNRGVVAVSFSTADGTGIAGTNYKTTTGNVTFLDGETSKTVSIPVLDDGRVDGDKTVRLILTNATGGATLGADAGATLVVSETDFDLTGPEVANVQVRGSGKAVTGVSLVFNEALDPGRATNPANYVLTAPAKNGRGLVIIPTLTPTYDSATHTVTITTARPLALNTFYRVSINGAATGVTDIFGNPLRGTNAGNGQDFTATFARGSALRYVDHDGDKVSLSLTNRGLLDLYRSADGDGQVLTVLGAGSRRSILSGNVKKGSFASDGVTTFQAIVGANFGRVDSRLTTPKFFVDEVTAFIRGTSATLATASIAEPHAQPAAKLFARSFGRKFGR